MTGNAGRDRPGRGMTGTRLKPALLARAVWYEVTGTELAQSDEAGRVLWSLDLSAVERAAYVAHTIRGQRMARFDLTTGAQTRSIALNDAHRTPPDDPDRQALRRIVTAVAQALARLQPDLQVSIGEYGRRRVLMFALGVLSALAGLGLIVLAAGTGVSTQRLIDAALPAGVMVLFGGFVIWQSNPWKPAPRLPVSALPALLSIR